MQMSGAATLGPGGRYRILRSLGQGGFGEVVCAMQSGPMGFRRKVAIKRLRRTSDKPHVEQALIAEARLGGLLRHKNIVSIYNLEEDEDGWLVVMEFVEGMTLTELIRRCRSTCQPLPRSTVIDIGLQICAGLEHAHALRDESGQRLGLVHRDIKPSNLMLTMDGLVKIMDFGIARTARWDDPMAGLIAGTRAYMSPEQLKGSQTLDHRSDLYSLGVVLLEMLTLEAPSSEPAFRGRGNTGLDKGLGELLERALAPAPSDRFQSAAAFGAALGTLTTMPARIEIDSVVSAFQSDRTEATPGGIDGRGEPLRAAGDTPHSEERPYRGLRGFESMDVSVFFGRNQESRRLAERIAFEPLVTVTGVSGVGKSSLLRAGVAPLLPDHEFLWCRPGTDPTGAVLRALGHTGSHRPDLTGDFSAISSRTGMKQVVVVDQAEELFTLCERDAAQDLATLIAHFVETEGPRVVFVVREDFFVQLVTLGPMAGIAHRAVEVVAPPKRAELEEVLCRPLESVGYSFEDDTLVEEILDEVEHEPAALALLQFCADRLWDEREQRARRLLRSSYLHVGGVSGALAHHAEEVYQQLTPAQRVACRDVMLKLVTAEGTRQPVRFRELTEAARDAHVTAVLLDHLVSVRLLNAREGIDGQAIIEVVHEALIARWTRLSGWRSEDHEAVQFRQNLRQAVQSWQQRKGSKDLLWRGHLLAECRIRSRRGELLLTEQERDFIAQSERYSVQLRRRIIGTVAVVLVSLLVLYGWAMAGWRSANASQAVARSSQQEAERHARQAETESSLNRAALESLRGNVSVASQISHSILKQDPAHHGARGVLFNAIAAREELFILAGHAAAVRWVTFSDDGSHILTASLDKTARIYRRDGRHEVTLQGHDGLLVSGRFSPDGTRVVTASRDHTARVWSVDGSLLQVLEHGGMVYEAAWSPDGRYIATSSKDATARIWTRDGQLLRELGHDDEDVTGLAWAKDGASLFTATSDIVSRWSVADGRLQWSAQTTGAGDSFLMSPSGEFLHVASWNGTREIWKTDGEQVLSMSCDTRYPFAGWHPTEDWVLGCKADEPNSVALLDAEGNERLVLSDHSQAVFGATFSPDGEHIAVIGKQGAVSLWNADGRLQRHLSGHPSEVVSSAWSPDGEMLATASDDQSVRLWAGDGSVPGTVDVGAPVDFVDWSPRGTRALVRWHETAYLLDEDGRIKALDAKLMRRRPPGWSPTGTHFALLTDDAALQLRREDGTLVARREVGDVGSLAWHPSGEMLMGASPTQGVMRWTSEGESLPSWSSVGSVEKLFWAPDGQHWLSFDGTDRVILWSAGETPEQQAVIKQSDVSDVCWRPGGDRVAVTSFDGTVGMWTADGRRIIQEKQGIARIPDCSWSPDGELLALASWDGRVLLRTAEGERVAELIGHTRPVASVSWRPDGSELVSAAWDTTARVWGRDGEARLELRDLHDGERMFASWSPDGRWLRTAAMGDQRVRMLPGTLDALLKRSETMVPGMAQEEP